MEKYSGLTIIDIEDKINNEYLLRIAVKYEKLGFSIKDFGEALKSVFRKIKTKFKEIPFSKLYQESLKYLELLTTPEIIRKFQNFTDGFVKKLIKELHQFKAVAKVEGWLGVLKEAGFFNTALSFVLSLPFYPTPIPLAQPTAWAFLLSKGLSASLKKKGLEFPVEMSEEEMVKRLTEALIEEMKSRGIDVEKIEEHIKGKKLEVPESLREVPDILREEEEEVKKLVSTFINIYGE